MRTCPDVGRGTGTLTRAGPGWCALSPPPVREEAASPRMIQPSGLAGYRQATPKPTTTKPTTAQPAGIQTGTEPPLASRP
jgi:hypothetical protein